MTIGVGHIVLPVNSYLQLFSGKEFRYRYKGVTEKRYRRYKRYRLTFPRHHLTRYTVWVKVRRTLPIL
jgi:hypothetical protein